MYAVNEEPRRSPLPHRSGRWIAWVTAIMTVVPAGVTLAAPASADLTDNLRSAIASVRGGACPLRSEPLVEQVNRVANVSTNNYRNSNTQGQQPIDDPGPGLKALGYSGTKSKLLRGWADNEGDAIKALLLQGAVDVERDANLVIQDRASSFITDCAFTDYGADVIYDENLGYFTSMVLAGPWHSWLSQLPGLATLCSDALVTVGLIQCETQVGSCAWIVLRRNIIRIRAIIVSFVTAAAAVLLAPPAWADDNVTYEVVSSSVGAANIEYFDRSERRVIENASLPWRADVTVVDAQSPSARGAEVRADWRGYVPASPLPPGIPIGYWVTVRILFNGKVLCQSTLDVGNATCYGHVRFNS